MIFKSYSQWAPNSRSWQSSVWIISVCCEFSHKNLITMSTEGWTVNMAVITVTDVLFVKSSVMKTYLPWAVKVEESILEGITMTDLCWESSHENLLTIWALKAEQSTWQASQWLISCFVKSPVMKTYSPWALNNRSWQSSDWLMPVRLRSAMKSSFLIGASISLAVSSGCAGVLWSRLTPTFSIIHSFNAGMVWPLNLYLQKGHLNIYSIAWLHLRIIYM